MRIRQTGSARYLFIRTRLFSFLSCGCSLNKQRARRSGGLHPRARYPARRPEVPNEPLPDRLYTLEEVAHRLSVSTKSVRRWIDANELRVYRLGRQLRICEDDLRSFLSARHYGGGAGASV